MKTLAKLLNSYMSSAPVGKVEWIGVRPERKAPVIELKEAEALKDRGLQGDRSALRASTSGRQVTLIALEDIQALSVTMGLSTIDPAILRRNIVVSGLNLHAMRYQTLQIGSALVEVGAHCHPCSRMEQALGRGGFLAMYMRGGYCCKVIQSGVIRVGDEVFKYAEREEESDQQGRLF